MISSILHTSRFKNCVILFSGGTQRDDRGADRGADRYRPPTQRDQPRDSRDPKDPSRNDKGSWR